MDLEIIANSVFHNNFIIKFIIFLFIATEFRAWLLHNSVPVLMEILPPIYLQHYSLLVSALSLRENITSADLTEADDLIDMYCTELAPLYGKYISSLF